jgi:hypothetical protein
VHFLRPYFIQLFKIKVLKFLRCQILRRGAFLKLCFFEFINAYELGFSGISESRNYTCRLNPAVTFNRRGKRGAMNWERLHSILENARLDKLPPLKSLWIENKTILNSGA